MMNSMTRVQSDALQRDLLTSARVIAVVGLSNRPGRASLQIDRSLQAAGYTLYPVNPTLERIEGLRVYPTLADVPEPIDIVNVFRRSEHLAGVVEEAIAARAKSLWAQTGVWDDVAAARAQDAGFPLVMDTCFKVSYNRLLRG